MLKISQTMEPVSLFQYLAHFSSKTQIIKIGTTKDAIKVVSLVQAHFLNLMVVIIALEAQILMDLDSQLHHLHIYAIATQHQIK